MSSFLAALQALLQSKVAVGTAAATLAIGGVATVATPDADDDATDALEQLVDEIEPVEVTDTDEETTDEETTDDGSAIEEIEDGPESQEEDGERSPVADAVHRALTGGAFDAEGNEILPGHPDFGHTVAERARDPEVHLGREVSQAAREANGSLDPEPADADDAATEGSGDDADGGTVEPATARRGGGPPAGVPRGPRG